MMKDIIELLSGLIGATISAVVLLWLSRILFKKFSPKYEKHPLWNFILPVYYSLCGALVFTIFFFFTDASVDDSTGFLGYFMVIYLHSTIRLLCIVIF